MTAPFWQQQPTTPYGTTTGLTLSTGAVDVEKGNIYAAPAGTPVSIPIPGRIAWEDSQHVVVQTAQGVLNFLHVNPTQPVGTQLKANQPLGKSSALVGTYHDTGSGETYVESGNIIEVGLYDSVGRAAQRENFVNGRDEPYNFTGISDPQPLFDSWNSGRGALFASMIPVGTNTPLSIDTPSGGLNMTPLYILGGILLLILIMRR